MQQVFRLGLVSNENLQVSDYKKELQSSHRTRVPVLFQSRQVTKRGWVGRGGRGHARKHKTDRTQTSKCSNARGLSYNTA